MLREETKIGEQIKFYDAVNQDSYKFVAIFCCQISLNQFNAGLALKEFTKYFATEQSLCDLSDDGILNAVSENFCDVVNRIVLNFAIFIADLE